MTLRAAIHSVKNSVCINELSYDTTRIIRSVNNKYSMCMNELSYGTMRIICRVNRNYSVYINELEIAIQGGYLRL